MSNSKKVTVVVEKLHADPEDFESQIINSVNLIGLAEEAKSAKSVFIKPNLTFPEYKKGVTTRVEFIRSLVSALVSINPGLKIYIGEGEGGYNSYSISQAFRKMGFFGIEKDFSQIKIINLSQTPFKTYTIDTKKGPYKLDLPVIFQEKIDFSISCPLPKVHCMTKVTLSYKNQWGCLPDTMRLKNHYMFDHIISKVADILKFKYAFLDGKYGLNNNGPMAGDPIEVNWFVASNSLGAFDMIVSEMMGFDWKKIGYLKIADQYGFIPKRDDMEIIGDIELLKRKFKLRRNFWNYPALVAFKSKWLTQLVYISKLAKPIHDIMYLFRKRPLD